MSRGRPISLKCPKCRRGKYGCVLATKLGVVRGTQHRHRWVQRGRRQGKTRVTEYRAECRDCQHVWWTSLGPSCYDGFCIGTL